MNAPKVSIIIPTYNVEQYILQCLESIAAQTYENYETIIIIDGATDHSYEISKNFCSTHEKFSVYWQENAGSGPARNNGLDHATGELIMFVDPDDWVNKDYVENLVNEQQKENYDLVTTLGIDHIYSTNGKNENIKSPKIQEKTYKSIDDCRKAYINLFVNCFLHAPHSRIYKKSIIDTYNIRFPDLRRSQDIVFNYRYYNYIKSLRITAKAGYNYRVLYKDRVARRNEDYYQTVCYIYREIIKIHDKWYIRCNKQALATNLFVNVYTAMQGVIYKDKSIIPICTNRTIQEIVENARPVQKHLVLLRFLLRYRMYFFIRLLIILVLKIK